MQDQPLLISSLIEFAERHHGDAEIVSRRVEGDIHRYELAQIARARAAGRQRVVDAQLGFSDRVATLGVERLPAPGAVLRRHAAAAACMHTINPRLRPEQIAWIINHAEDQILCFDIELPAAGQADAAPQCNTVKQWIALCDADKLPADTRHSEGARSYEEWIGAPADRLRLARVRRAQRIARCATPSGTTGNPKGALYSHRSTLLPRLWRRHCPTASACRRATSILPVVPMFHVNAWGIPYTAAMVGAKMVLPGAALDGESVYELMETEGVNLTPGVPTVWLMLFCLHRRARPEVSTA